MSDLANTREIRLKIKATGETKKITKAMKMMAAVKLRKAREAHNETLPFFEHIQETMIDILQRLPNIETGFFDTRDDKPNKKTGYIVITSDRGLTGSYNHNVIKLAKGIIDKETSVVFPIGAMVENAMIKDGYNVVTDLGIKNYEVDTITASKITDRMIKLFQDGTIDELKFIYTDMKSAMTLRPNTLHLLPLDREAFKVPKREEMVTTLELEPTPEIVFDVLANKYVKGVLYGGMIESFVSEQLARMNAMDSATTNAENVIEELTRNYNRVRQASITQEITEIIAGMSNV